jgi:hypothetical protein
MSLKGFHVVFVSASALLAFGFAAWCIGAVPEPGTGRLLSGAASVGVGIGLFIYGAWFLKKMRGVSPLRMADHHPGARS